MYLFCISGKLEWAWEWERSREVWERERLKEDMKKKRERREERKKRGTLRAYQAARPLSEEKQPACALRVQWLDVDFNAYSGRQIRYKTFREKEATSVHRRQLVPLSDENGSAFTMRAQRFAVFASYWSAYFRPCWVEWLFRNGSGVWGQYQGLIMIPTIMLPSLTGTLE